jgi:hypothetical protein
MAFMDDKWHSKGLERIKIDLDELIDMINIKEAGLPEEELNKRVRHLTKLLHLKSSIHRLDQGERRLKNNKNIAIISFISAFISLIINFAFKAL